MNNNDLHGTLVLVRPDLKDDPAKQQGKVGILTYVAANEDIFVSFRNHAEGRYTAGDLFQLKDKHELFSDLMDYGSSLGLKDYKDLYKISLLQDSGRSTDILHALEIAGANASIRDKSLVTVQERMGCRAVLAAGR